MSTTSVGSESAWQTLRQGAWRKLSRTLLSCVPGQSLAGYFTPAAPTSPTQGQPAESFVGLFQVLRDVCEQMQELQQSNRDQNAQLRQLNNLLGVGDNPESAITPMRLMHDLQLLQTKANGVDQQLALLHNEVADAQWELRRELLRQRGLLAPAAVRQGGVSAPRHDALDFAASLAALEQLAPHAYRIWKPLLDVNAEAYEGFPVDSCSVSGHPMAELFTCFLAPLLRGNVLDIGCGPQPVPAYLLNYPVEQIAGLDPLPQPHPFQFHHGVAEFLPWHDGEFDVVLAATSLDHVLLLDRTFDEIRRVLRPGGQFITWVSFVPGAQPYQPYRADVSRLDAFHLFHFDRGWFEALMEPKFRIREAFVFDSPHHSGFYSFEPR